VAASGVLLIVGTLQSLGYDVAASSIVLVIATLSNLLFDRKLAKKYGKKEEK